MIGSSKNNRENYSRKCFWTQVKETGLSAYRPSNDRAQIVTSYNISPLTSILAQETHVDVRKLIPTEKGRQFEILKLKENLKTALANLINR